MRTLLLLAFFLVLVLAACDQSFNPKGTFQRTLAVYAVLSTATDTILIRVNHTYDPSAFDPLENTADPTVSDATVQLFKDDTAYTVQDTLLNRSDKSRYITNIKAYVAKPFPVEFGASYMITIASAVYGTFQATMMLPTKGVITISNSYVLDYPKTFKRDTLFLAVQLSAITRGYLLRAFLEYEFPQSNQTIVQRMEVPTLYRSELGNGLPFDPAFPVLRRRTSSPSGPGIESGPNDLFQVSAFLQTADLIHSQNPAAVIKRAILVVNQVEPNFYNYYNIANGFRDGRSVRIDEPGFSNIHGGEGVFGGFTVEEVTHNLPLSEYN